MGQVVTMAKQSRERAQSEASIIRRDAEERAQAAMANSEAKFAAVLAEVTPHWGVLLTQPCTC